MKTETFYTCENCKRSFTDEDSCKEHEEVCSRMLTDHPVRTEVIIGYGGIQVESLPMPATTVNQFMYYHMTPHAESYMNTGIDISISYFDSEKDEALKKLNDYLRSFFAVSAEAATSLLATNSVVKRGIDVPRLTEWVYKDYKSKQEDNNGTTR